MLPGIQHLLGRAWVRIFPAGTSILASNRPLRLQEVCTPECRTMLVCQSGDCPRLSRSSGALLTSVLYRKLCPAGRRWSMCRCLESPGVAVNTLAYRLSGVRRNVYF